MSYWVGVYCDNCGSDYLHENMTSNVSGVWDELGCPLRDWSGLQGIDVLPKLQRALDRYENMLPYEKDKLGKLVRGDNWGSLEGAIRFLEQIRNACALDPVAKLSVNC